MEKFLLCYKLYKHDDGYLSIYNSRLVNIIFAKEVIYRMFWNTSEFIILKKTFKSIVWCINERDQSHVSI